MRLASGFRFTITFLFVVLFGSVALSVDAQERPSSNILVLNSYYPGYKWTDDLMDGIHSVVASRHPGAVFYVEYMDTKRFPLEQTSDDLRELYRSKYRDIPFDVIICSDNNAFDFLRQHRDSLFGNVPVVFCGINFLRDIDLQNLDGFTGVNEEADLAAGLSLALQLHPERKRIYIVNDMTTTGLRVHTVLEQVAKTLPQDIEVIYLEDLEMTQIIAKLQQLTSNDMVFYTIFFRDKAGSFFEFDTSIRLITENSPVPVYGTWDFSLGYGIVGGMLTSGYFQGRTAADLASKILNGTPVEQVPPVMQSPNHYMFDYKILKKFNIDIEDLPLQRIIINQPDSFYASYKKQIWITTFALLVINLFVLILTLGVAQRRRLEAKIIKSQQRLKTILETTNEGFWEVDRNGVVIDVNPEMCVIFGKKRNKIVGRAIADLVDAETAKHILHHIKLGLAGQRTNFEISVHKPDGTVADCLCSLTPRFNEDGSPKGAFTMVADISDIKVVQADLKQSQGTLNATFDSTGDGLIVVDEQGVITHLNQRLAEIWSFPYAWWGDKSDKELMRILMERLESPQEFTKKIRQVSRTSMEIIEMLRFNDGRVIECFSTPLMVDAVQKGRVWSFRDVTDKKNLENQLIQAQKMEAIGNLAGGIAHDFNNRLQAVTGYTQLLLLKKDRDDSESQKLRAIQDAAQKSCELTRQLLTFSRRVESTLQPTDLNHEVRLIKNLLSHTIARTIEIHIDLQKDLYPINADPGQIEQVITNLGINAWHAMPEGGAMSLETRNVYLDQEYCSAHLGVKVGQFVRLQISDTGHGMERETMARIFEPFFTTKGGKDGTGLGLAMVHGIVKNHGGHISCKSDPGVGTMFQMHFPALVAKEQAIPLNTKTLADLPRGKESILLVDDEQEILDIGQSYLQEFGYNVECASGGRKVVERYTRAPDDYDLIILDINMPEMDGYQALRALKQIDPHIKVMITSGYASKSAIEYALSRGANGFVGKPYKMEELICNVRRILDS